MKKLLSYLTCIFAIPILCSSGGSLFGQTQGCGNGILGTPTGPNPDPFANEFRSMPVTTNDDFGFLVDGVPFFPLGNDYESCLDIPETDDLTDPNRLKFGNIVRATYYHVNEAFEDDNSYEWADYTAQLPVFLDYMYDRDIKVIVDLYSADLTQAVTSPTHPDSDRDWNRWDASAVDANVQTALERFTDIIDAVDDHPAVFGYYLTEEPTTENDKILTKNSAATLNLIYEAIKGVDTEKPVIVHTIKADNPYYDNTLDQSGQPDLTNYVHEKSFDLIMPGSYRFGTGGAQNINYWNQVSDHAYEVTRWRNRIEDYRDATIVPNAGLLNSDKLSIIGSLAVHDKYDSEGEAADLTKQEFDFVNYQMLTSIVHGARGLRSWPSFMRWVHPETVSSYETMFKFFLVENADERFNGDAATPPMTPVDGASIGEVIAAGDLISASHYGPANTPQPIISNLDIQGRAVNEVAVENYKWAKFSLKDQRARMVRTTTGGGAWTSFDVKVDDPIFGDAPNTMKIEHEGIWHLEPSPDGSVLYACTRRTDKSKNEPFTDENGDPNPKKWDEPGAGSLLQSTDGGATWQNAVFNDDIVATTFTDQEGNVQLSSNFMLSMDYKVHNGSDYIMIAEKEGYFICQDAQNGANATWNYYRSDDEEGLIRDVEIANGFYYYASYKGLKRAPIGPNPTFTRLSELPTNTPGRIHRDIWDIHSDGIHLYVATALGVWHSDDDGDTWTECTGFGEYGAWCISSDGTNVYVGMDRDGIYKASLGSTTFVKQTGFENSRTVWSIFAVSSSNEVYAGSDGGNVYRSTNGGTNWTNITSSRTTRSFDERVLAIYAEGQGSQAEVVGGIEHYNQYYDLNGTAGTDARKDFEYLGYTVKQYEGSYYLFVSNDFRTDIEFDLDFGPILNRSDQLADETVYRIVELKADPNSSASNKITEIETQFYDGASPSYCEFPITLNGYDAKVFRIDVLRWTETDPYDLLESDIAGAGIALPEIGGTIDFNGNARRDVVLMYIEENPGHNQVKFVVLPDANKSPGIDGPNGLTAPIVFVNKAPLDYAATDENSNLMYTSQVAGDMRNASIGWDHGGGGADSWDIGNTGQDNDLYFMAIDDPWMMTNSYRSIIAGNMTYDMSAGSVEYIVRGCPGTSGYAEIPAQSDLTNGGGMSAFDFVGSGLQAEVFYMENQVNSGAPNEVFSQMAFDSNCDTFGGSSMQVMANGNPPLPERSFGWTVEGGGNEVCDLDADGNAEVLQMTINHVGVNSEARIMIKNFFTHNPPIMESGYAPYFSVPMCTFDPSEQQEFFGGMATADIDFDGDMDVLIMNTIKDGAYIRFCMRFGINGRVSGAANPSAKSSAPAPGPAYIELKEGLAISPNPAQNLVRFDYKLNSTSNVELSVVDLLGRVLFTQEFANVNGGFSEDIDVSTLANGSYNCRIVVDGQVVDNQQLVISR